MIVSLRGLLAGADADRVVIEAGGLGYGVLVPGRLASALSRRVGDEVFVHTYLHVRDDALQLFGFESPRERRFFVTLIGVSGVGPKVALAILSAYSVAELETAVVRGDDKRFESITGIGRKLAQRLVIELKDTVGADLDLAPAAADGAPAAGADPFLQARVALQNLGLPLREAEAALQGAPEGAPLEELVRFALTRKAAEQKP
jgi:Holliday junction DNA helicase RuvA